MLTPTWTLRSGGSSYGWIYLFQSGRYDATSMLYGFRNRYLSPTLGRWAQVDPIGFAAGDDNLYAYLHDGPDGTRDPSGLIGIFLDGAGQDQGANTIIQKIADVYDGRKEVFYHAHYLWNNINSNTCRAKDEVLRNEVYHMDDRIDIFGYSRGAIAAISVCQRLREAHLTVTFLGIIDPVRTMCFGFDGNIPSNVKVAWIGMSAHVNWLGLIIFNHTPVTIEDKGATKIIYHDYNIIHQHIGFDEQVGHDLAAAAIENGVPLKNNPFNP